MAPFTTSIHLLYFIYTVSVIGIVIHVTQFLSAVVTTAGSIFISATKDAVVILCRSNLEDCVSIRVLLNQTDSMTRQYIYLFLNDQQDENLFHAAVNNRLYLQFPMNEDFDFVILVYFSLFGLQQINKSLIYVQFYEFFCYVNVSYT